MGCRKLTYRETLSPLKVVYNDLIINENCYVGNYRYGFNGMERDDNVKGKGNSYTTEFRQYDPRGGRWLSLDPLMAKFPWQSPYVAYDNNPILLRDPKGLAAEWKDDGNGTYTAEKGDGAGSLAKDAHIPFETANKIIQQQYGENYKGKDGKMKSNIVPGNTIKINTNKEGEAKPTYTPPPKELPGFPDAKRDKPKGGRPRWKLPDGDIGEWDGQHGEVERYNPRGKHKGVWDPDGNQIKDPVPGRKITPYISPQTVETTTQVVTTVAVGYALYVGIKWVVAIAAAPETGGASLLLIATP